MLKKATKKTFSATRGLKTPSKSSKGSYQFSKHEAVKSVKAHFPLKKKKKKNTFS